MSSYIHREILLFFQAVCTGGALALCYDLLVILRRLVPHSRRASSAEDLLYWIAAGLFLFVSAYCSNEGILRLFLLLGILAGLILCRKMISPFFVKTSVRLLGIPLLFVKKAIKRLLFWGKRCKIFLYHPAETLFLRKNKKDLAGKRTERFGKGKKKKKKKNKL